MWLVSSQSTWWPWTTPSVLRHSHHPRVLLAFPSLWVLVKLQWTNHILASLKTAMECNKTRNGWQTSGSSLQQNVLKETSDHRYQALICSNVFQNVCISPLFLSLPLSLFLCPPILPSLYSKPCKWRSQSREPRDSCSQESVSRVCDPETTKREFAQEHLHFHSSRFIF